MKKYIILTLTVLSIIFIIIASGYTRIENINYIKGIEIKSTHADKYINCSGKIVYADTNECKAQGSGVVEYAAVDEGERVNIGDVILITAETKADIDIEDIYSALLNDNEDIEEIIKKAVGEDFSVTTYKAEKSGIIRDLSAGVNDIYTKGSTLFEIADESTGFEVIVNIPESVIETVEIEQSVEIDARALPCLMKGHIKEIDSCAKQTGSAFDKDTTVRVVIGIDNNSCELKSGYTADCRIKVKEKDDALIVPFSSVEIDEGGMYVYLINGNKCEKHSVVSGEEYSTGIEILNGIETGDVIVYDISSLDKTKNNVFGELKVFEQ